MFGKKWSISLHRLKRDLIPPKYNAAPYSDRLVADRPDLVRLVRPCCTLVRPCCRLVRPCWRLVRPCHNITKPFKGRHSSDKLTNEQLTVMCVIGHLCDRTLHRNCNICEDGKPTDNYINSYSASHDNWCTGTPLNRIITAQWKGMGDVGPARYEPALLPPCPTIRVLSYSNCQRPTHSHFRNLAL